jgi:hypothetical protein
MGSSQSPPWHVQYRRATIEGIDRHPGPEFAIEAACRLIDDGCDVYSVGTGPLTDSIGPEEIRRIHAAWVRAITPFGIPAIKPNVLLS